MLPALLATFLFSLSVIFANRSTRILGSALANMWRLSVATVLLAFWAHVFGCGFGGGAFGWFFLSGCVGFGLGDLSLYLALPRLGPRLTALLMQCLAAPLGAAAEWIWLGTTLSGLQIGSALVILVGVAVAVAPREHVHLARQVLWWGLMFGLVAALGQGLGAVISRKAYEVVAAEGGAVDGLTATYQRILGGLLFSLIPCVWLIRTGRNTRPPAPRNPAAEPRWFVCSGSQAWVWVLLNSLAGPSLGVACYQWALQTTPSGIVLPIVATMPVVVIPLALFLDRDRPSPRSVIGGVIAVGGVVALGLA